MPTLKDLLSQPVLRQRANLTCQLASLVEDDARLRPPLRQRPSPHFSPSCMASALVCQGCSYRSRKARGSKVTVEITTEADTSSRAGWPSASLRDIRDAALIGALDAASFELGSPTESRWLKKESGCCRCLYTMHAGEWHSQLPCRIVNGP
jgi:hypothetical protein